MSEECLKRLLLEESEKMILAEECLRNAFLLKNVLNSISSAEYSEKVIYAE